MEIGINSLILFKNPDYIAFKKGILSEKEFKKRLFDTTMVRLVTSGGYLALGFFALPVGLATLVIDLSLSCLDEHLLTKEYEAKEGDIAIEDILSIDTRLMEISLKGDRVISTSQEQIEMLMELKKISPTLIYKIIG